MSGRAQTCAHVLPSNERCVVCGEFVAGRVQARSTWLCRLLGHRYRTRGAFRVDGGGWVTRQVTIPLVTYCKRCGGAPEAEQGWCDETTDGLLGRPLGCCLTYGHKGQHKDPSTGAIWTPGVKEKADA